MTEKETEQKIEEMVFDLPKTAKRRTGKINSESVNRKGINTSAILSETVQQLSGISPDQLFIQGAMAEIRKKDPALAKFFEKNPNLQTAWNTSDPETARSFAENLNNVRKALNEKCGMSLGTVKAY